MVDARLTSVDELPVSMEGITNCHDKCSSWPPFNLNGALKISFRLTKPFIDLLIVITGVSIAFLLSNWNERSKEAQERKKVIASLQVELDFMATKFPAMADWQTNMNKQWDSLLNGEQIADFNTYYYLQPQHNYSVLEYALDARNTNVVDFALHQKLLMLHKGIKMLEESEVYMTQIALAYQADAKQPPHEVSPQNLFLFKRFIGFARNRAMIMRVIAKHAEETLPLLKPH